MPSNREENLKTVMIDFLGALRRGDDGRIVRIDDYRDRAEALSAAGIDADPGWR